jgi:hypothetical protein
MGEPGSLASRVSGGAADGMECGKEVIEKEEISAGLCPELATERSKVN